MKNLLFILSVVINPMLLSESLLAHCENFDADEVQVKYNKTYDRIVENGFSINQLSQALAAVRGELSPTNPQGKAQQNFERRASVALMLLVDQGDAAPAFREKLRQSLRLLKEESTPQVDQTIFTIEELAANLATAKAKLSDLNILGQKDLNKAMAEKRRLDLDENIRLLEKTLELISFKNDRGQSIRKAALSELLRALQPSPATLMLAKCKFVQALKDGT